MLQLDDAATIKERPVITNSDNAHVPEQPPTPGPEIRPMEPNKRIIRTNGVDLCVQTFGDSADPPSSSSWEGHPRWTGGRTGSASVSWPDPGSSSATTTATPADRSATSRVLRPTPCAT